MPTVLAYETDTSYELEMCDLSQCPGQEHSESHFKRQWDKNTSMALHDMVNEFQGLYNHDLAQRAQVRTQLQV